MKYILRDLYFIYYFNEMNTKTGVNSNGVPVSKGDKHGRSLLTKLDVYIEALRPWSFSASLTPVALGCTLASKHEENFNFSIFLASCFTALSVHSAGNLVNTYCDFRKGIDDKKSDDRTLVDRKLTPNDVAWLGAFFYILGCIGFIFLSWLSPARMEHLALLYFGGLSSSFLYTGGLQLKYIALGDILIFFTFGPLTVMFSYLSQVGDLSLTPLIYAVPLALNTEAILHSNNTRDMAKDSKAGIVTLAILLGRTGSYVMFIFLLLSPYIAFMILGFYYTKWMFLPVVTVIYALKCEKLFRLDKLEKLPQQVAKLNLIFGLLYVFALIAIDKSSLPLLN